MFFLLLKKEAVIERSFILVDSQTGEVFFRLPILSEACGFMHFLQPKSCFLKVSLLISSLYSNPMNRLTSGIFVINHSKSVAQWHLGWLHSGGAGTVLLCS